MLQDVPINVGIDYVPNEVESYVLSTNTLVIERLTSLSALNELKVGLLDYLFLSTNALTIQGRGSSFWQYSCTGNIKVCSGLE